MIKILKYVITYRPVDDAGKVHLILEDGTGANLPIDSPQEATFILDLLRNEQPVYYDPLHQLLSSGIEGIGEGEEIEIVNE